MFDGVEIGAPAVGTTANGLERNSDVLYLFTVEHGEGPDCGGEDSGWESDFGFGGCERDDPARSSFVERDGEALFNITFPE